MIAESFVNLDKPPGDTIASFRVPAEPKARSRSGVLATEAWRYWFRAFRVCRLLHDVADVSAPCRVEAIVRRCEGGVQNPVTEATILYWTDGVRDALVRSGLVAPGDLRGLTVTFRKVEGVPLVDRPAIEGTHIIISAA